MQRDTDELIRALAADARPVRPLALPWRRAAVWAACSLPYVALVILAMTPRSDVAALLGDPRFVVESLLTLGAALAAACAAFASTIPGYRRSVIVALLAVPAVWLATMTAGCAYDWIRSGAGAVALDDGWRCFPAILVSGAVPAAAIAALLRRGAPLTPALTLGLGALAAAALADLGLRFHHGETGLALLLWHFGAVTILFAAGARAGRAVLRWKA
jgi:hypothetical protein